MKAPATLVFDIGKTAKKVLLFDEQFEAAEEKVEHFAETRDDDGFACEDLPKVTSWVLETLEHYMHHAHFDIKHINFSAYGASLVHLDKNNEPFKCFYNYLKPFPEKYKTDFLTLYNQTNQLLTETASPWLGMLNSGLQLYWVKHEKPALFEKLNVSLHLPQYFSFLVTKKQFSDITSIGCHTLLWNFKENNYHDWVKQERLTDFFGPVTNPDHFIQTQIHGKPVNIGIGVHDSSAALMPYLVTHQRPFILLSTGTWNIAFNPFNQEPLTADELRQDCLCYMTVQGKPVKASRVFLGHEFELQIKAMAKEFRIDPSALSSIKFNEAIYVKLSSAPRPDQTIYPIGMEGTGPLPDKSSRTTDWSSFENPEEAYHQMIRALVKWQLISLHLVDPHHRIAQLIVVGGFTKNEVFLEMLKREAKHLSIHLSDHPRAAALGAAWLVKGEHAYRDKQHLLNVYPL